MTQRLHHDVLTWFDRSARDLPWRRDPSPWSVLVSEVMLQQTPVSRVLPVFAQWMARWPTPAALAADPAGEAVRAWDRLGYPRRALRLHAAATSIVERHGGEVPSDRETLLTLPGVGDYTASAVASFAFGGRHAVLDTNVRRVLARAVEGVAFPAPSVTAAERALAESLLPAQDAHRWAAAHDGARCAGVHGSRAPMCGLPDRRSVPMAGGRVPRARRTAPTWAGPGPERTGRSGAG